MKFAIHTVLIATLAAGSWGCSRTTGPNESVSANSGGNAREERTEPARQAERRPVTPVTKARGVTATAPYPAPSAPAAASATANVPAGTALTVTLADAIGTETNKEGDTFVAHLTQPITVNGNVVAEKGDPVMGRVKTVQEPGRVKGRARLELVLNQITVNREKYSISTEPFIVVAGDNKDRDAAIIAGGAGVGAVVGAVTGGKKGAALGAIIGGGTGTTAVMITKGEQLKLDRETRVNFVLADGVNLPVIRKAIS